MTILNRLPFLPALVLLVAGFMLTGCSETQIVFKETKKLYNHYVVPNPSLDLDSEYLLEDEDYHLASLMKPVDERVLALRHYVDGADRYPDDEWFQNLFSRFPWINGVMVVDTAGIVDKQLPGVSLKPLDVQPLLDYGEKWNDHKMRALAQKTEFGPEMLFASPLFQDNELKGLLVVYFDPRKLLEFCSAPDELIMLSPTDVLWAGNQEASANELSQQPWDKILSSRIIGSAKASGTEYRWLACYLGDYHLIYSATAGGAPAPQPAEAAPPADTASTEAATAQTAESLPQPEAPAPTTPEMSLEILELEIGVQP